MTEGAERLHRFCRSGRVLDKLTGPIEKMSFGLEGGRNNIGKLPTAYAIGNVFHLNK